MGQQQMNPFMQSDAWGPFGMFDNFRERLAQNPFMNPNLLAEQQRMAEMRHQPGFGGQQFGPGFNLPMPQFGGQPQGPGAMIQQRQMPQQPQQPSNPFARSSRSGSETNPLAGRRRFP